MKSLKTMISSIREQKKNCYTKLAEKEVESDENPAHVDLLTYDEALQSGPTCEILLKQKSETEENVELMTVERSTDTKTSASWNVKTWKSKRTLFSSSKFASENLELQEANYGSRLRYRRGAVGEDELKQDVKMLHEMVIMHNLSEMNMM